MKTAPPSRALVFTVVPILCSRAHSKRTGISEDDRAPLRKLVATNAPNSYRSPVAANSATRLGGLNCPRRYSAHLCIAGAFFVPASQLYGGLRGSTSVCAGSLGRRSANPAQPTTQLCLAAVGGGPFVQGATPMLTRLFALSPSEAQNRAERHRARAVAQLKSKSSLKVRHERYNSEMARARFFESLLVGGAQ